MVDIMESAEFHTQLTTIMETLSKAAVLEISKLFAEKSTLLRLEISRCTNENDTLKKKCLFLEKELKSARKSNGKMNSSCAQAPRHQTDLTETPHRPEIDNVFGKEWCMSLWRHEESNSGEQEDDGPHLDSSVIIGEPVDLLEEEPNMLLVKEENFEECSLRRNEEDQGSHRVKVVIQEEIKRILPELDFRKVQNVVNHLWFEVGVEKAEDLSLVEVVDLKGLLEPIQCRKLVKMFRERDSNEQVDGEPSEKTLTSLFSNECLPEPSIVPHFPLKSSWVRNFRVPWGRMPTSLMQSIERGERARPSPRREFVRIIVAAMQAHCPNPNLSACGEVAQHIVSTYPLTFGDISEEGEQIGNGFSCLQRQLKTRVEHVNRDVLENRIRRPRKAVGNRAGEQDECSAKKVRCKVDSYGCINWQPSSIPEGETTDSLEMKRKVVAEIFQSAGPKAVELPNVEDLMNRTYIYQRHMINSCPPPTISELEEHWPFLFTERGLCRHLKVLTGIDIRSRFTETLSIKAKRILSYFTSQRLKWNGEIQSLLSDVEECNSATNTNRAAISAILLMMRYFKEQDNSIFILADETSSKTSIENEIHLPETPRLIMLGDTLLTSSKWFISIEGKVRHCIDEQMDFAAALAVFFGCFYVFNIEYQESASTTLEFIQRFFVRINPEGTKCTSKSGTSRRTGSAVQRKSQHFNSRVATFMQRLSEFEWKTSS